MGIQTEGGRRKSGVGRLALWFDTSRPPSSPRPDEVDWLRVLPFVAMHLACFAAIWVGVSGLALLVMVGLYVVRMLAITGFYHRYFSHRTFRTSRVAQLLFAIVGCSAAQRGPLWWAAHHRRHHRHADTPEDPHSPKQRGLLWSHMGWFTAPRNFQTDLSQVPDLARYPELRFLDRFDMLVPLLLAVVLFLAGGAQLLVWGFFISTVLLFHGTCVINSLAHRIGRRRYETPDESRNSLLLTLITLGEGWHNNHHHYPATARQGFYWWEIDPTWYFLLLLQRLRIIRGLRGVPAHVREAR